MQRGPSSAGRLVRLLLAIPTSSVAFVLVLHAHVGLGPWHVVQQGIGRHLDLSIGTAGWVMGFAIAAAAALLGERCGVATLAVVVAVGAGIDLVDPWIGSPGSAAGRALALLVGTAGMALGGALLISARSGVSPLDAFMTGAYRRSPWRVPISGVRLLMEVVGLTAGILLGGDAGIGSIVIGAGIGPAVHGWLVVLRSVPDRALPDATDPAAVAVA